MALSANMQREKDIHNYIKIASKKYNWQFKGWFTFKKAGPFIFSSTFYVGGKMNCLNGNLSFKPLNIDNLFYEITGREDYFKKSPLSYKVNSNGMLYPYNYYTYQIDDITNDKIDQLLNLINEKEVEILETFSNEDSYYEFVQKQIEKKTSLSNQQLYLTNLIYLKKYEQLLDYIEYCKENNITSGFSHTNVKNPELSWDYYDKLVEYAKNKLTNPY